MLLRRGLNQLVATLALLAISAGGVWAQEQAVVTGLVTDEAGTPLANVQVLVTHQVTGTQRGTYTNQDGNYLLRGLSVRGPYRIEARRIGYGTSFVEVEALDPAGTNEFNFALGNEAVALDAIEVFADRAVEQQTPVAYSTVDQVQIKRQLASRDLPIVLNTTPSVYATEAGGGAGDARINVRGFSQRNVAVMINGVPVNDMENGWVYWSNWDGVGDFTRSIQLQRGLSAVNLATPSIGGTMNLITDPTALAAGASAKQEWGDFGFMKTTVSASSGLINDKFAVMAAGIRKSGDGLVQGAWTDAWAYYFAGSWIIDNANRLDLYATGAPQRHGQRLYAQNIGAFDADFATGLDDYDPAALSDYPESEHGLLYNENFNTVSCNYDGMQAVGDKRLERHDCAYLNERENFFHKPQVNLNWFSQLSDALRLSTVGYYSGGRGGGTGTLGDMVWDYSGPSRIVDWNATIDQNRSTLDADGNPKPAGESVGILRNSRNNQWTLGAISKLKFQASESLGLEVGVDYRIAEIEHYREVRDLLGGDYYVSNDNDFNPGFQARLGDKVDYFNTNKVNWIGTHLQGQYVTNQFTAYGMVGTSAVKYHFTDHFRDDGTGQETVLDADWQPAFQVKGGGLYNVSDQLRIFANAGYVEQMPIFDQIINDASAEFVDNPKNQKFISGEIGARYRSDRMPLEVAGNIYYTQWADRVTTQNYEVQSGTSTEDVFITLTGLQQVHRGIELEAGYQPLNLLRFDGAVSFNHWEYTDDVNGTYRDLARDTTFTYDIYVNGLKVGNAPQTQFAYTTTLFPIDGLYIQLVGKSFMNHYSDYSPFDRDDPNDRAQPWQAPDYSVFDLHAGFNVPRSATGALDVQLFANVFNLFDAVYIQDALDNSPFNAFDDDHDADDAEVFFGLPRRLTLGASVAY